MPVLVIDDDDAVRDVVENALNVHGYEVVSAATIQEAEDMKQRLGVTAIVLVICDIHLTDDPQLHEGYTLYQQWTTSHPALPFLLMSGDPQATNLPDVQSGAVYFLPKPFAIKRLLEAVQALIRG